MAPEPQIGPKTLAMLAARRSLQTPEESTRADIQDSLRAELGQCMMSEEGVRRLDISFPVEPGDPKPRVRIMLKNPRGNPEWRILDAFVANLQKRNRSRPGFFVETASGYHGRSDAVISAPTVEVLIDGLNAAISPQHQIARQEISAHR